MGAQRQRLAAGAGVLLVAAACFVAFLPALDAGFVDWDDDRNFVDNPSYRGLGWAQIRWMLTTSWMGHYIPLTWVTLGLNYVLGGMAPRGYHLGNVLLHAANAGLLYLIARRLIAAPPARSTGTDVFTPAIGAGAAVAALVFGLHPLRVESVAWVTERRDVLCGFFYLLAVLAYLQGTRDGQRLGGRWHVASLAAFVAALASKGMAMTLPLTLLVLDVYPLRRSQLGWRVLMREKWAYAVLAGLGALAALWAVTRGAAFTPYEAYGPSARVAMAGYAFGFYPRKLLWPVGLSPLYELPARVSVLDGRFLGAILAVAAVTVALIVVRRRWPGGLATWIHSAIVLLPVSGLVHAGHQLAHDRYSYLSGLGFAVLAGAGATGLARARARRRVSRWVAASAAAGVALALVLLATGSWQQSRIWRDSESLWRAAVDADPGCALCAAKLGHALMARGFLGEAEAELRRATALRPDRPGAHSGLGELLFRRGRLREAEAELREALRLGPRLGEAQANLGALYANEGRNAEAIPMLREALVHAPWLRRARTNLGHVLGNHGTALARNGELTEATTFFREAVTLLPDDADAWRNLGQALVEQGKSREAIDLLERAVTLRPRGAPERFWLARAYWQSGRRDDAEQHMSTLRALDPAGPAARP